MNAAEPRAIAEDITFGGPKPGDNVLIRALERARSRLVLATPLDYRVLTDEDGRKHIQFGPVFGETEFFAEHGIQPGWTGLPVDDDDVVRRIDYAIEPEQDARFATLASASARAAGVRTGELASGAERRASDGQSSHTTWIDYHGGAGTFRSVSARDVLSGRVTADAFRDKIVVIGLVSRQFSEDWHPTSLDDSMAGPEINANAISTMLAGSDLRDVSRVVDVLLIVALGLIPLVAWTLRSRLTAAALIVGAALLFAAAAYLLFASGWIVAVVAPLAALALASLGILLVEAVQPSMRRRAR